MGSGSLPAPVGATRVAARTYAPWPSARQPPAAASRHAPGIDMRARSRSTRFHSAELMSVCGCRLSRTFGCMAACGSGRFSSPKTTLPVKSSARERVCAPVATAASRGGGGRSRETRGPGACCRHVILGGAVARRAPWPYPLLRCAAARAGGGVHPLVGYPPKARVSGGFPVARSSSSPW